MKELARPKTAKEILEEISTKDLFVGLGYKKRIVVEENGKIKQIEYQMSSLIQDKYIRFNNGEHPTIETEGEYTSDALIGIVKQAKELGWVGMEAILE